MSHRIELSHALTKDFGHPALNVTGKATHSGTSFKRGMLSTTCYAVAGLYIGNKDLLSITMGEFDVFLWEATQSGRL